jgi:hypothetical protein
VNLSFYLRHGITTKEALCPDLYVLVAILETEVLEVARPNITMMEA